MAEFKRPEDEELELAALLPAPTETEDDATLADDEARRARTYGSIADNLSNRRSFGEFFTGKFAPTQKSTALSGMAEDAASRAKRIRDGLAKYKGAIQEQKLAERNRLKGLAGQRQLAIEDDERQAARQKEGFAHEERLARLKLRGDSAATAKSLAELSVPGLGMANTPDDAKKLKDASVMKQKLDSEIGELIALRKEFGGETLNRNAVARAKQLASSLLLTKKNLENLGVLSQADKDIVDSIIPKDPLEHTFSPFQDDSIMTKLTAFRDDTNRDYDNQLKMRLRAPAPDVAQTPPPNGGSDGWVVVSNGTERRRIQASDLNDAIADGYSPVGATASRK